MQWGAIGGEGGGEGGEGGGVSKKVPYDAIHNTAMLDPSHPDTNARCTAMMISPPL